MNLHEAIAHYGLTRFPVSVQSLEQTLIDKIFAICDYQIRKRTFEADYKQKLIHLLYRPVSYEESIMTLDEIIRARIF